MIGRRLLAGAVAAASAAVVAVVYRVMVTTTRGQVLDEATRSGAYEGSLAVHYSHGVLDVVSAATLLLAVAAVVLVGVVRRRPRLAVSAAVLVIGSTATTQLLKKVVLPRPDLAASAGSLANSLPSGHTTFAASVSLAVLLAVPVRLRAPVALAGAAYTAVTGVATLVAQWHRASDVVAAIAVVGCWAALVSAVTPVEQPVAPAGPPGRWAHRSVATVLAAGALGGAVAAALCFAVTWPRTGQQLAGLPAHVAFLGGALATGTASCAVVLAVMLLRRPAAERASEPGLLTAAAGSVR